MTIEEKNEKVKTVANDLTKLIVDAIEKLPMWLIFINFTMLGICIALAFKIAWWAFFVAYPVKKVIYSFLKACVKAVREVRNKRSENRNKV